MASRKADVLAVGGREVTITNPDKVYFPRAGHTKLDLVRYYLAVAEGALVGVRDRPMALKRFVDGVEGEFFFQKRAPEKRPEFVRVATLSFPSGRTADEVVIDEAAGLAWVANLGCIDLNPHPVRAGDLDHPDELRVDLDPVPGVPWSQIREVALVAREALADVGLVGWPKTSGSRGIHVNVRIEPRWTFPEVRRAALALARDVERRAPAIATSKWWKEERHGVFLDYNQNAKDRTVASAYSVRPTADARVSMPLRWEEVADGRAGGFHARHRPGTVRRARRPGRRHRRRRRLARRPPRAVGAPRDRGPRRCAVAAELPQAGWRATARPALAPAPAGRGLRQRPRPRREREKAADGDGASLRRPPRRHAPGAGRDRRPRAAAGRRSRSSRSPGRPRRTRRWPVSSAGRRAGPRRRPRWRRRTCSWTRCAGARPPGPASG